MAPIVETRLVRPMHGVVFKPRRRGRATGVCAMVQDPCPNLNHRRSPASVRFCPECGELVNPNIASENCAQEEHAVARRKRHRFCMRCGEQLIK